MSDKNEKIELAPEDIPSLVAGARVAQADPKLDQFMEEVFGAPVKAVDEAT